MSFSVGFAMVCLVIVLVCVAWDVWDVICEYRERRH